MPYPYLTSYGCIVPSIFKIRSSEGRCRAFSTCSAHLISIILFYGPVMLVYLRPASSRWLDSVIQVLNNIVTPSLNPLIYTLRNKDVKLALRKVLTQVVHVLGHKVWWQFLSEILWGVASDTLLVQQDCCWNSKLGEDAMWHLLGVLKHVVGDWWAEPRCTASWKLFKLTQPFSVLICQNSVSFLLYTVCSCWNCVLIDYHKEARFWRTQTGFLTFFPKYMPYSILQCLSGHLIKLGQQGMKF